MDCTLELKSREAKALPGYLTVVLQMLKFFCRNTVLSSGILRMKNHGADGILDVVCWYMHCIPPCNALAKMGEPANYFSWCVLL